MHQWNGQIVTSLTPAGVLDSLASARTRDILYVGRTEVAAGLRYWYTKVTPDHYVVYEQPDVSVSEEDSRPRILSVLADATISSVEVPECTTPERNYLFTDGDHAYVGGLDVDLVAGTATCLNDIAPDPDAGVAGSFSDGTYLFESYHYQYWVVTADGSRSVPLTGLGKIGVQTRSDHLVTDDTTGQVTTLRAYPWSDATL